MDFPFLSMCALDFWPDTAWAWDTPKHGSFSPAGQAFTWEQLNMLLAEQCVVKWVKIAVISSAIPCIYPCPAPA